MSDKNSRQLKKVLADFAQPQKRLSSKWFYDQRGSELFEAITELPEYYVTRTEALIFETHIKDIAASIGPEAWIVEYGAGALVKVRLLLDQLQDTAGYIPIDISEEFLGEAAKNLRLAYPNVKVFPKIGDLLADNLPDLDQMADAKAVLGFFPGSTIGNFTNVQIKQFFENVRTHLESNSNLLIGFDMEKSQDILLPAYDDAKGVTSEFNLNALHHLNRQFDGNFVPGNFSHRSVWRDNPGRIEMHLVSGSDQSVRLGNAEVNFTEGEYILTEISRKFAPNELEEMASEHGGWTPLKRWHDPNNWYSLLLFN